eukprot:134272_1
MLCIFPIQSHHLSFFLLLYIARHRSKGISCSLTMPYVQKEWTWHASTVNQLFAKIAEDPNVQWMSRYGALKQSQQYVRRKMAIKYLQILSGGDHLQLINDLLTPMDVAQHIEPCNNVCIIYSFVAIFIYYFVTFIQIIRDLITATNTWTDTKCKSHYLQFISPYYSLNELKSLECTCGWRSHHTSKQWRLLHRTITPFDPKFGRKPFGSDVEQNIFEFLESNSRIAANNISAKHNTLYEYDFFEHIRCGFLTEYHGKNWIDGHFGDIMRWYFWYCSTHENGIHDTQTLCGVIESSHINAQKNVQYKLNKRRVRTILNNAVDPRPLHVKCVNFDTGIANNPFTLKLKNIINDSKRRLVVPHVTSWAIFEVFKTMNTCKGYRKQYMRFRRDRRYHRCILNEPNKPTELRNSSEIKLNGAKDNVTNWCNRINQKRSGNFNLVFVNDYPSLSFHGSVSMQCEYSVAKITKVKQFKEQAKRGDMTTKELLRKKK